jgi:hypothetical protein
MDKGCYEPLCEKCQVDHIRRHRNLGEQYPPIKTLETVEKELLYSVELEIKARTAESRMGGDIKNTKDLIKDYVDEFFYRSAAERLRNLRIQKEILSSQPSVKAMLDILTEDNGYFIDEKFQRRFETFLAQNLTLNN